MPGLSSVQKKAIDGFVSLACRKAAETYNEATGSPIPPELMKFMASFISTTLQLSVDSAISGKMIPQDLSKYVVKLIVQENIYYAQVNQAKIIECGVGLPALAISFEDYAAFMTALEALDATVVMAPEAIFVRF